MQECLYVWHATVLCCAVIRISPLLGTALTGMLCHNACCCCCCCYRWGYAADGYDRAGFNAVGVDKHGQARFDVWAPTTKCASNASLGTQVRAQTWMTSDAAPCQTCGRHGGHRHRHGAIGWPRFTDAQCPHHSSPGPVSPHRQVHRASCHSVSLTASQAWCSHGPHSARQRLSLHMPVNG